MKPNKGYTTIEVLTIGAIAAIALAIIAPVIIYVFGGGGSFGPTKVQEVMVQRLYVDRSSDSSHYMVGTDKGVFEVENGAFLGVWNADELYSTLREGKKYRITTEGNKIVNFIMQEYPYITAVQPTE